jgi:hypothetical protein
MLEERQIFICHASEDKATIVDPIVQAFEKANISVWYDKKDILLGESIPATISDGLSNSRYVLVVLSKNFINKSFAQEELYNAIFKQASSGTLHVLPVLVADSDEESKIILEKFSLLSNRRHVKWSGHAHEIVSEVLKVISPNQIVRVCHISSEYPHHILGGLGIHVKKLTDRLSKVMAVDIIVPSGGRHDYETPKHNGKFQVLYNIKASYEDSISWIDFSKFASDKIYATHPQDRPQIIHCHDWVSVLAGIKCKWRLRIPFVFHLHLPNKSPLCASIENLGLVCADLVTVNSEAMRAELLFRGL